MVRGACDEPRRARARPRAHRNRVRRGGRRRGGRALGRRRTRAPPWRVRVRGRRPRRRITVDAAAAELRDLLVRAVDDEIATILRRSAPDAPHAGIAAHLSGGLDSTTVTFLASEALARHNRRLDLVLSWSPDRESVP